MEDEAKKIKSINSRKRRESLGDIHKTVRQVQSEMEKEVYV